jgi:hypothetical protein
MEVRLFGLTFVIEGNLRIHISPGVGPISISTLKREVAMKNGKRTRAVLAA